MVTLQASKTCSGRHGASQYPYKNTIIVCIIASIDDIRLSKQLFRFRISAIALWRMTDENKHLWEEDKTPA